MVPPPWSCEVAWRICYCCGTTPQMRIVLHIDLTLRSLCLQGARQRAWDVTEAAVAARGGRSAAIVKNVMRAIKDPKSAAAGSMVIIT